MTNSEANVPATAPVAAAIVLLPPNVTFATGDVKEFHVTVEAVSYTHLRAHET